MPTSQLLTSQHLSRKAIIYIRQSTPHQVLTNQESLNLQYALKNAPSLSAGAMTSLRSSMPISV